MIKFNKKIYEKGAIEQAIKDYRKLAIFDSKDKEDLFSVSLKAKKGSGVANLEDEFCNHVLGLGRSDS